MMWNDLDISLPNNTSFLLSRKKLLNIGIKKKICEYFIQQCNITIDISHHIKGSYL